jgi:hypothetical protein
MTVLLAAVSKLIRDKDPTADLFRQPIPIDEPAFGQAHCSRRVLVR